MTPEEYEKINADAAKALLSIWRFGCFCVTACVILGAIGILLLIWKAVVQ